MSLKQTSVQNTCKWLTASLTLLCVGYVSYAILGYQTITLEARLLPQHMRGITPWKTITAEEVEYGTTIPPHSNVIFHLPIEMQKISRKTLFGHKGKEARYWGYCFPENYSLMQKMPGRGLPGRLFLSEREREVRREEELAMRRSNFQITRDLTEERLNEEEITRGRIRHQKEVFKPGETCYMMTELPIPIGVDLDEDGANTYDERQHTSDPEVADTDGDGVMDGDEIFGLGTNPNLRDSDGDGLIDGLEDLNRNGMVDLGETNPAKRDSDGDGLCDGLCRTGANGIQLHGEDVNLNGEQNDGETSPLHADSDNDGILDDQEYYNCILETAGDCKYSAFPIQ